MAKRNKNKKIDYYEHSDKERLNNPPVGLVNEQRDPSYGKKKQYKYDPHIDPELQWDQENSKIRDQIESSLKAQQVALDMLKEQFHTMEEAGNIEEEQLEKLQGQIAILEKEINTLKKAQEPYLNWAGKAERISFEVPTVSLHVHERIDPKRIIQEVHKESDDEGEQLSLFAQTKKPLREAIEFYKHKEGWTNRLIAGDSLLVMNSLLEKEGMAGKVQMVIYRSSVWDQIWL